MPGSFAGGVLRRGTVILRVVWRFFVERRHPQGHAPSLRARGDIAGEGVASGLGVASSRTGENPAVTMTYSAGSPQTWVATQATKVSRSATVRSAPAASSAASSLAPVVTPTAYAPAAWAAAMSPGWSPT